METLKNAAAIATTNPERLAKLIDDLSEIEGAAGNLRGVLFEKLINFLHTRWYGARVVEHIASCLEGE